jgi:uncharacterized protein involved in exopolysaccharide biosynthesis
MKPTELELTQDAALEDEDSGPRVSLVDLLTWLGQGKRVVAIATVAATAIALAIALLLPPVYTARTTLLPPASQQQGGSAAALAALGALGGLAGNVGAKTPDELYVTLLKSDSVIRALDERFDLHLSEEDIEGMQSVADLLDILRRHGAMPAS